MARGDAIAEVLLTSSGANTNIRPTDDGDEWIILLFGGNHDVNSRFYAYDGTNDCQITTGASTFENFGMKMPITYSHYAKHYANSGDKKGSYHGYITKEA